MFSARKAGQMAAFFADRQGGRINILKLMKLLYLADRESMARHGEPISFDRFVSMDHGPVLTQTLNLIDGTYAPKLAAGWDEWISDRAAHMVEVNRRFSRDDLDQLSDADLDVLESVWRQFCGKTQWELVDYTHQHCAEWQDPQGSSLPIAESDILRAVGVGAADELAEVIDAEHRLDRRLSRA